MAEIRLVPVILTMVAREDIMHLFQGVPLPEVRQQVIARLHREADAQGGTLAELDTCLLLCQSQTAIGKAVRAYEQEHACIVPRRGTVHDMGRSVTHKAIIAKKAFLEAKQAPQLVGRTWWGCAPRTGTAKQVWQSVHCPRCCTPADDVPIHRQRIVVFNWPFFRQRIVDSGA